MRWRLALALVTLGVSSAAACDLESDSNLGDPSGLKSTNLPSPDASTTMSGDAGGLCNGAGPVDGGTCQIKFGADIWPLMAATGTWACADSNCHGGTSQSPAIHDPASAYTNLAAWHSTGGRPYINPCSTDVDASAFVCNLEGACGAQAMPIPDSTKGRGPATPTDIGKVVTWLQCGSPNN